MYKAVLIAPDGDWRTDYVESATVEDVEESLADQGSRWYFYPFHAVIRDNGNFTSTRQRLVSVAYPFEDFKGKTISTLTKFIAETEEDELRALMGE